MQKCDETSNPVSGVQDKIETANLPICLFGPAVPIQEFFHDGVMIVKRSQWYLEIGPVDMGNDSPIPHLVSFHAGNTPWLSFEVVDILGVPETHVMRVIVRVTLGLDMKPHPVIHER